MHLRQKLKTCSVLYAAVMEMASVDTRQRASLARVPRIAVGMQTFSDWLQQQMDAQGIGQCELAARTGVGPNAVKAWLMGGNVTWHNCRAIADALGASRDYVRQMCGYVDPEDEPAPESEPEARELMAIFGELDQRGKDAALEVMRALRQTRRATGRSNRRTARS